ncbi:MAG: hypothetical protein JWR02_1947 [Mucilaginibacter sp.]|nr:hypothetical protein [Mucilaginibacter sp.]
MKKFHLLFIVCLLIFSCSSIRMIKYQKQSDDVFANHNLKEYLKSNASPKIVLRVPNTNDKATSNTVINQNNNVLYNAIEKELLKEGFNVRDRGLFNEIIDKSKSTDYTKIGEETNTDLILEVVSIDPSVMYSTNKITIVSGEKSTDQVQQIDYKKSGASVEFKLILVKNNEIGGNYKFNYTPCSEGCPLTDWSYNKKSRQLELKETVAVHALEEFITKCTQDLIRSFKS